MAVTSFAVTTTKVLFGMCDCTFNSDVGTGSVSLVLGILHVCGIVSMQSHVFPTWTGTPSHFCTQASHFFPHCPVQLYSITFCPSLTFHAIQSYSLSFYVNCGCELIHITPYSDLLSLNSLHISFIYFATWIDLVYVNKWYFFICVSDF